MNIGYVGSLSFTEQSQLSHDDLFWQLRGNWRSPHCQTVLDEVFVSHLEVLQHPVDNPKRVKCVNSIKVLWKLFQNWHLTKNDQKWLKKNWAPTNALVFFVVVVVVKIFWLPPRLVWTPASQAPCGYARLTPCAKSRPQAAGFAGKIIYVI